MDGKHFISVEWLKILHEEARDEDKAQRTFSIKLIQKSSRALVWNMCRDFGCDNNGIPGLTCLLIERYFSKMFHLMSKSLLSEQEILTFNDLTTDKFSVLIAVIIKLVVKTTGTRDRNCSISIREFLDNKYIFVTAKYITDIEFDVFSKLGFHIPFWTSVDAGMYLSVRLGLAKNIIPSIANIINFTEKRRDVIEKKALMKIAKTTLESGETYLLTLHIIAGAIAQAVDMVSLSNVDIMPGLSDLVVYPIIKINCIKAAIAATLHI